MTFFAVLVAAIALSDWAWGLAGERLTAAATTSSQRRARFCVAAAGVATLLACTAASGLGLDASHLAWLGLDTAITAGGWAALRIWVSWPRENAGEEARAAGVALGVMTAALALNLLAATVWWPPPGAGWLTQYLEGLPLRTPIGPSLLIAAMFIAQVATANSVVRLVLSASGTLRETDEEPVKGGRWIGPAERVLLLLLVLAGEITAAGLVTAAKGLLRKDEATGVEQDYVVLGTLVSLTLALVPALLLRAL